MGAPKYQWEKDVIAVAMVHLKDSDLWSDETYPENGFHLQPKPKFARLDVVELNHLSSLVTEEKYKGVININVQHTDVGRIYLLSEAIELVMNDAYIERFLFTKDFFRLFKSGKYLFFNNLRYSFEMAIEDFNKKYVN